MSTVSTRNNIRVGMFTPEERAEYQDIRATVFKTLGKDEFSMPRSVRDELDDMAIISVQTGRTDLFHDPEEFQAGLDAHAEQEAYDRLRAQTAAKRRIITENGGSPQPPTTVNLTNMLAQPDDETEYMIDGLFPAGTCQMLAAQAKAGKTRLIGNLIRSIVDGDPFLDKYEVQKLGTVTLIDNEMDERMTRRWLRAQGIRNTSNVEIVSLRGQVGAFNILDPAERQKLVRLYEGSDVYIFDCLRPSLDALGLDENREAGQFVQAWKAFVFECGGEESVVAHHMGHNGERARGDSGLIGGVDGTWKIILEDPTDPDSDRFFSAHGRNVSEPEQQLAMDGARLGAAGGSRKEARTQTKLDELTGPIIELIKKNGGWNGTDVARALKSQGITTRSGEPAQVLKGLVAKGVLRAEKGERNARHYYFAESNIPKIPSPPELSRDDSNPKIPLSPTYREGITGIAQTEKPEIPGDNSNPCPLHPNQPIPGCYTCDGEIP